MLAWVPQLSMVAPIVYSSSQASKPQARQPQLIKHTSASTCLYIAKRHMIDTLCIEDVACARFCVGRDIKSVGISV